MGVTLFGVGAEFEPRRRMKRTQGLGLETQVKPEVWDLVSRLVAVVPPGAEMHRHPDSTSFLYAVQRSGLSGHHAQALAAARLMIEASETVEIEQFYKLAQTAWQTRTIAPRSGRRFWRMALLRARELAEQKTGRPANDVEESEPTGSGTT